LEEASPPRGVQRAGAAASSPSAAAEGAAREGLRYPEWDWRRRAYRPDYCRVFAAPVRGDGCEWSPPRETLRRIAKVRRRFEAYRPRREQARAQIEGDDLDLDAVVRARADCLAGAESSDRIYLSTLKQGRDLAVALLVDASLSTDAWIGGRRVIDIARESALIFCHALDAEGEAHAVYAFSSKGRHEVRVDIVKDLSDPLTKATPRLGALKPGLYTRIGAALRHVAAEVEKQPAREKLVIVLTDGKPNDVDHYEGRFGVEDTRKAIMDIRRRGIRAFGVTIDERAGAVSDVVRARRLRRRQRPGAAARLDAAVAASPRRPVSSLARSGALDSSAIRGAGHHGVWSPT
jgi:nitric oxide reductase NorD protein